MEALIVIAGFAGGWLLVAGSIYQAALELKEEGLQRDHAEAIRAKIPKQKRSSPWWWLAPPVKLIIEHRNSEQHRKEFLATLPREDIEAMLSFINKATGWLFVASGGLLIAFKETYELIEHFKLSEPWFWILVVALSLLCFANTAVRIARSERALSR